MIAAAVFVAGVVLGTASGLWWALSSRTPASPAHVHEPSAIGVGGRIISAEEANTEMLQQIFRQLGRGELFEIRN